MCTTGDPTRPQLFGSIRGTVTSIVRSDEVPERIDRGVEPARQIEHEDELEAGELGEVCIDMGVTDVDVTRGRESLAYRIELILHDNKVRNNPGGIPHRGLLAYRSVGAAANETSTPLRA